MAYAGRPRALSYARQNISPPPTAVGDGIACTLRLHDAHADAHASTYNQAAAAAAAAPTATAAAVTVGLAAARFPPRVAPARAMQPLRLLLLLQNGREERREVHRRVERRVRTAACRVQRRRSMRCAAAQVCAAARRYQRRSGEAVQWCA